MRFHPRFSIRTLLILTALAAAVCYWWIIRPTIIAQRFVDAINERDFEETLILSENPLQMLSLITFYRIETRDPFSATTGDTPPGPIVIATLKAMVLPREWSDIAKGQRRIEIRGRGRGVEQIFLVAASPRRVFVPNYREIAVPL